MPPRRFYLPPIILYAGLSVKKKAFFKHFFSISMFGIAGTYVSFIVSTALLFGLGKASGWLTLSVRPSACLASPAPA